MVTIQGERNGGSMFRQRKFLLGAIGTLAVGAIFGAGAKLLAGGSAGPFQADSINSGDTAWVLASSALVMVMTPAVGFFLWRHGTQQECGQCDQTVPGHPCSCQYPVGPL